MEMNKVETNKNKIIFILLLTLSEKWNNEILVALICIQLSVYILRYGILKDIFNICKYLIYIFIISVVMSNINIFYSIVFSIKVTNRIIIPYWSKSNTSFICFC